MVETKVRVVNEFGENVPQNGREPGEIIVKGPGVMEHNSEGNNLNRVTSDGWLYTGDIGTVNENGRITIIDRRKDIALNGREDISSIEIENVLNLHPAIQEVAIIATPDIKLGETINAFVVLKERYKVTGEQLINFSKENFDYFISPISIIFMDELPRTASGKILKAQLKEIGS